MKRFLALTLLLALALSLTTCAYMEDEPEPDYLELMIQAAANGDVEAGRQAEALRAESLARTGSQETPVSFDELYLLAKFIYYEAGSWRLSPEQRLCVGEVVLNRVASPEYPGTIADVIYQPGQYEGVTAEEFENNIVPSRDCVKVAMRLLLGERMLEPCVVYQGGSPEGVIYAIFCDQLYGYTYFCESPNLWMYRGSVSVCASEDGTDSTADTAYQK